MTDTMSFERSSVVLPTDREWYAMVSDAAHRISQHPDDVLVWHTINVLREFMRGSRYLTGRTANASLHRTMVDGYRDVLASEGRVRMYRLMHLGNAGVFISGYFPALATRRRLSVEYYTSIARAAYDEIASIGQLVKNEGVHEHFTYLAQHVIDIRSLLGAVRERELYILRRSDDVYVHAPGHC